MAPSQIGHSIPSCAYANGSLSTHTMTSGADVVHDYLGCPSEFVQLSATEELSADPGFFRCGDIMCYGRFWKGSRSADQRNTLDGALPEIVGDSSGPRLPFSACEVIENLRFERYVGGTGRGSGGIVANAYYLVRPFLSVSLRRHLQRVWLRGWDKIPFPEWPVDTTVERLIRRVVALSMQAQGISKIPFVWFWPDGANAALFLSHDVETAAGRDFCSAVMDLDSSFRLQSSFQIIPEERYSVSDAFVKGIRDRGFEINVHDLNHDGHLFRDRETFLRRVTRINDYAQSFGAAGFRSGVLYRNLDWYDALAFSYDMSVPNVAHLEPQRGGCCTVMPFYIGKILELPLTTTQDYSLFNILGQYSLDLWKQQIGQILNNHGLISFNIHPDYLMEERARSVYVELLRYVSTLCSEHNIWAARPGDINEWWRQRSQMRVVREGEFWRIKGPGSDRARLAWMLLDGNETDVALEAKGAAVSRTVP